jgi:5-deoxy-glucuronate isomerase
MRPERGFELSGSILTRSLDETVTVQDDDTVLVPRGYHAGCAPPGYDLYYLNVMVGPVRERKVKDDPDHEWLLK